MSKRLIIDSKKLNIILQRLCQQLIENYGTFQDTVIIGLQPRGIFLAERLIEVLKSVSPANPPLGYLDITFHRDDFRRRAEPLKANETRINFMIENKHVILIDDVLFTGRSVRAALDAMTAFGRPKSVVLLTLIDRVYTRELPIEASYVGMKVNTLSSQKVLVEWNGTGSEGDAVWLMDHLETA